MDTTDASLALVHRAVSGRVDHPFGHRFCHQIGDFCGLGAGLVFTLPLAALCLCSMNVLMWFKRDLRVNDNPALQLAAGLGAVLPLYIVEPDLWAESDHSARQWEFTAETLAGLRADMAELGAPLVVRTGEAIAVLDRLCRQYSITQIVSQSEPAGHFASARNARVAEWARGMGLRWTELPAPRMESDDPLVEDDTTLPAIRAVPGIEPGMIPSARALRIAEDRCAHRQIGGRDKALALLDNFLTQRAAHYRGSDAAPLLSERISSRLSPHLAVGALSRREVVLATQARLATRPGTPWTGALGLFQTRLMPAQGVAAPVAARSAMALAWAKGETGLPFLDASMRYLASVGWLHHRLRSFVLTYASLDLGLDWRQSASVLAQRCTDYDPAIHWAEVARLSRTTRLIHPVKLGQELDPTAGFIRQWLPELAKVPVEHLHAPWRWPGAQQVLGRRYPEPIVDIATAQRAARDRLHAIAPKRPFEPDFEVIEPLPGRVLRAATGQLRLDL